MRELWRKGILTMPDDAWVTQHPYSLIIDTADKEMWDKLIDDTLVWYHPGLKVIREGMLNEK